MFENDQKLTDRTGIKVSHTCRLHVQHIAPPHPADLAQHALDLAKLEVEHDPPVVLVLAQRLCAVLAQHRARRGERLEHEPELLARRRHRAAVGLCVREKRDVQEMLVLDLRNIMISRHVSFGDGCREERTHVAPPDLLDALALDDAHERREEQALVERELADERRRRAVLHRLQHALHVVRARRPFLLLHELDRASV